MRLKQLGAAEPTLSISLKTEGYPPVSTDRMMFREEAITYYHRNVSFCDLRMGTKELATSVALFSNYPRRRIVRCYPDRRRRLFNADVA